MTFDTVAPDNSDEVPQCCNSSQKAILLLSNTIAGFFHLALTFTLLITIAFLEDTALRYPKPWSSHFVRPMRTTEGASRPRYRVRCQPEPIRPFACVRTTRVSCTHVVDVIPVPLKIDSTSRPCMGSPSMGVRRHVDQPSPCML